MTLGDYIRSKSDKELAEMFVNTINANIGVEDVYLVSSGCGVVTMAMTDRDLEEQLGEEFEGREDN